MQQPLPAKFSTNFAGRSVGILRLQTKSHRVFFEVFFRPALFSVQPIALTADFNGSGAVSEFDAERSQHLALNGISSLRETVSAADAEQYHHQALNSISS
jgi:hypothetical protein